MNVLKSAEFVRAQAITSAQTLFGEWTAPSTPVVLLYRKRPNPGSGEFKWRQDAFVVGAIGHVHDCAARTRDILFAAGLHLP